MLDTDSVLAALSDSGQEDVRKNVLRMVRPSPAPPRALLRSVRITHRVARDTTRNSALNPTIAFVATRGASPTATDATMPTPTFSNPHLIPRTETAQRPAPAPLTPALTRRLVDARLGRAPCPSRARADGWTPVYAHSGRRHGLRAEPLLGWRCATEAGWHVYGQRVCRPRHDEARPCICVRPVPWSLNVVALRSVARVDAVRLVWFEGSLGDTRCAVVGYAQGHTLGVLAYVGRDRLIEGQLRRLEVAAAHGVAPDLLLCTRWLPAGRSPRPLRIDLAQQQLVRPVALLPSLDEPLLLEVRGLGIGFLAPAVAGLDSVATAR